MPRLIFILFMACAALFSLQAQTNKNTNEIDVLNRRITQLDSGKFEIEEFTYNNVLVYIGGLSSIDPMIRDGKYTFFDLEGNQIATGNYSEDVPIGEWIYFDKNMDTLAHLNYNSVWNYIGNEDGIVSYDTSAMENLSRKYRKLMKEDGTFEEVDELPLYDSSDFYNSFTKYVRENLILPVFAQKNNMMQRVFTQLTLDYLGKIRNVQVLQSNSTDLSAEAIRVILASRMNWEPAKVDETPVNVKIAWEFNFRDAINYNYEWYEPPRLSEDSIFQQEFKRDSLVYIIVENMPEFNNGDPTVEFRKFVATELEYPDEAAENRQEGLVVVQFIVDPRGVVCDPVIVRGAHPLLDEEAIRVVMASPRWTPGRQRGKPVSVLFTFPINFTLSDNVFYYPKF